MKNNNLVIGMGLLVVILIAVVVYLLMDDGNGVSINQGSNDLSDIYAEIPEFHYVLSRPGIDDPKELGKFNPLELTDGQRQNAIDNVRTFIDFCRHMHSGHKVRYGMSYDYSSPHVKNSIKCHSEGYDYLHLGYDTPGIPNYYGYKVRLYKVESNLDLGLPFSVYEKWGSIDKNDESTYKDYIRKAENLGGL